MEKMSLSDYLAKKRAYFEEKAVSFFPDTFKEAEKLLKAMKYSFFAGGKRFRPVLALAVCDVVEGNPNDLIPACLAIEMIHTYSLIHDDLPAMDNDDFRRGKKSNHKVFGEATAILAGDGLLTEAFYIASLYPSKESLISGKLNFITALADAAGIRGMVGGQMMDIAEEKPFKEDYLLKLHASKTGAMIRVSALAPLILFNVEDLFSNVKRYAEGLGLLFQITDDILDVESSSEKLGKTTGKDLEQNKLTFVTLFGLEKAKQRAKEVFEETIENAYSIPGGEYLAGIADYVYKREK